MITNNQQAVVLAGGLGTRLGSLTSHVPKPMVLVKGIPYLQYQLAWFRMQGVTDVVLLTGYLGDQIESYFGNGKQIGLRLRYLRENQPLGTGGALRQAKDVLNDVFLLVYGDSYCPMPYTPLVNMLATNSCEGVLTAFQDAHRVTSVRGNVDIDDHQMVIRYDKYTDHHSELPYVEAGVFALRRTIADRIPCGRAISLENEIFPAAIAQRVLKVHITSTRFYDIGTPKGLKVFEEYVSHDYYANTISN